MIVLDTHIWMWWVADLKRLTQRQQQLIRAHEPQGLGVSIISCWEIAKKHELGKLQLGRPVASWLNVALQFPGIQLLPLTPEIVVDSTQLPGPFHRDPAYQIIVATSRIHQCPLLTADGKLMQYAHVMILT